MTVKLGVRQWSAPARRELIGIGTPTPDISPSSTSCGGSAHCEDQHTPRPARPAPQLIPLRLP